MGSKIPEFFCTTVRKVEPIGADCVRVYHSIEKNGAWQDVFTVVIPIASVLVNAKFVTDSASAILNESRMKRGEARVH